MRRAIYIGKPLDETIWCDEHRQNEHFLARYGMTGEYEPLTKDCEIGFFHPDETGLMPLFVGVNDVCLESATFSGG